MAEIVAVKVNFDLAKSLPAMGRLLAVLQAIRCPPMAAEWLYNVGEDSNHLFL